MTVEQAKQRLLALIDQHGGYVAATVIEADPELAANQEIVSAAAHALATEPGIVTGEETDGRAWFPYSLLMRAEPWALRRIGKVDARSCASMVRTAAGWRSAKAHE